MSNAQCERILWKFREQCLQRSTILSQLHLGSSATQVKAFWGFVIAFSDSLVCCSASKSWHEFILPDQNAVTKINSEVIMISTSSIYSCKCSVFMLEFFYVRRKIIIVQEVVIHVSFPQFGENFFGLRMLTRWWRIVWSCSSMCPLSTCVCPNYYKSTKICLGYPC